MGGEKYGGTWERIEGKGSPPRGRGKVDMLKAIGKPYRITPAWAGKSSAAVTVPSSKRDHPRVGGEKY